MSSIPERHEKNCLNCNAQVQGKFCHICGQENIKPNESFWHLTFHFVADIFHYDGKFLRTLKYLLFKPGYLAKEHLRGRRVDYLHPIRLYIFVSFIFFLVIYTFYTDHEVINATKAKNSISKYQETKNDILEEREKLVKKIYKDSVKLIERKNKDTSDKSVYIKFVNGMVDANYESNHKKLEKYNKSLELLEKDSTQIDSAIAMSSIFRGFQSVEEYEKDQAKKSDTLKASFLERKISLYFLKVKEISKLTGKSESSIYKEYALSVVPKVLFVGLPLIAFCFWIFYIRNKKFTYVNHLIFTLYLFCFLFINFLFFRIFQSFVEYMSKAKEADVPSILATIISLFYIYKSFRNFYQQGRFKTIVKIFLFTIPLIFITGGLIFLGLLILALTK